MITVLGKLSVLQTRLDLGNSYVPELWAQVGTEYMYTVNDLSMYKGVQLKSKLQHVGTWSAAAWPPCPCYRPTVFLRQFQLLRFQFRKKKTTRASFSKILLLQFPPFLDCASLKLCKCETACVEECLCMVRTINIAQVSSDPPLYLLAGDFWCLKNETKVQLTTLNVEAASIC